MTRRSEDVRAPGGTPPRGAYALSYGVTGAGKAAMQAAVRSSLTPYAQEWPTPRDQPAIKPTGYLRSVEVVGDILWATADIPQLWPKMPATFYQLVPELDPDKAVFIWPFSGTS